MTRACSAPSAWRPSWRRSSTRASWLSNAQSPYSGDFGDVVLEYAVTKVAIHGWREQTKDMDKSTNYRQALLNEVQGLPEEAFPNLLEIVRLFKESMLLQSRQAALALQEEFAQWDQLSDEALVAFE